MFVNNGGAWKVPKQISVKDQGVWKRVGTYYTKASGTWKMFNAVPSNVVLLYNQMPSTGYICDGSNGTPNLINKAIAALDTPLQIGGNDTHYGSDHGPVTLNFSYYNATWLDARIDGGALDMVVNGSSACNHTHDSIGLSSGGTCDLRLPGKKLIPIIGQYQIEPNCIFLRANSVSLGYLLYLSDLVGKYLYLANTVGDASYTNSVTHVATGITTSRFTITSVYNLSRTNDSEEPARHYHTANVYVTHDSPTPVTKTYIPYQTTAHLNWNDVPSGTIIFVVDNNLPSGYSWISFGSAALLKGDSTSGGIIGSTTHSHGMSIPDYATGKEYLFFPKRGTGPATYYMNPSHNIFDHNPFISINFANSMPAYVTLRLAVKN